MRSHSTQVGPLAMPVGGSDGVAVVHLCALIMNDWTNDKKRFESQRERFESERERFYLQDKSQAIQIAELKKDAITMLEEKVRFEQGFNVRGGLERICYQAVLDQRIPNVSGTQRKLDALASTDAFGEIYMLEISTRKLIMRDVERCRKNIYHELSKHAHGNEGTILIRRQDFTPEEVVAVLSYYKLQDAWNNALPWMEVGDK
ncbi:hypothetical protein Q9L58_007830 [Maublancomyces gigas]|uniref:Uncharacterized protein n=1 Tax=Discina gigas TaxID=1032678 RepID=A0ABR3GBE3_9PEZI